MENGESSQTRWLSVTVTSALSRSAWYLQVREHDQVPLSLNQEVEHCLSQDRKAAEGDDVGVIKVVNSSSMVS
jgi:hypothetical protein